MPLIGINLLPYVLFLHSILYSQPPQTLNKFETATIRTPWGRSHGRCPNTVVPLVAAGAPKRHGVEPPEALGLLGVYHALGGRGLIPSTVIAVRVLHVLVPEAGHLHSLLARDGGEFRSHVTLGRFNGVHSASIEDKVGELSNVRSIFVIDSVFASIRGPIRPIPYRCIQRHRFGREVPTHGFCPLDLSYGHVVDIKAA